MKKKKVIHKFDIQSICSRIASFNLLFGSRILMSSGTTWKSKWLCIAFFFACVWMCYGSDGRGDTVVGTRQSSHKTQLLLIILFILPYEMYNLQLRINKLSGWIFTYLNKFHRYKRIRVSFVVVRLARACRVEYILSKRSKHGKSYCSQWAMDVHKWYYFSSYRQIRIKIESEINLCAIQTKLNGNKCVF